MCKCNLAILGMCVGLLVSAVRGEAIAYQGQLREAGEPANGLFDLSFQLYASEVGNDPVGSALPIAGLDVVDGLFTAQLDFGSNLHTSAPRWLEITVDGQVLTPRVALTAAPFAINTRGLHVSGNGNVGIGTDAPQLSLDVALPSVYNAPALGGFNNNHYAYLHVGQDNPSLIWDDQSSLRFGAEPTLGAQYTERMRITADGKVGINTQAPADALHVVGGDNDGVNAVLRLDSGTQTMLIDGNELDTTATNGLFLNNNNANNVSLVVGGGKVGIGTGSPIAPLGFKNDLGAKISLYGNASANYGFGIQASRLLIHSDQASTDIAFGFGTADAFTENVRFKGNGRVGIGTNAPTSILDIRHSGDFFSPIKFQTAGVSGPGILLSHTGSGGKDWTLLSVGSFNGTAGDFLLRNESDGIDALALSPTGNVDIGSFASPDTHLTLRTQGGNLWRAGVKLRHFNDDIGWDIESDERNSNGNGLHIIRYPDNQVGITAMFFDRFSGNVGIGTTTPGTKLDVAGEVRMNVATIVGGSDIAEPYDVMASGGTQPAPGMVVSIDSQHVGKMRVSDTAFDLTVAGIISGANGVNPGITLRQTGTVADGEFPVASIGRVWCWCDADANGAIAAGDRLTTSSTPGHAMKVNKNDEADGAIIGKAMSTLQCGRGLVLVLVSLK